MHLVGRIGECKAAERRERGEHAAFPEAGINERLAVSVWMPTRWVWLLECLAMLSARSESL